MDEASVAQLSVSHVGTADLSIPFGVCLLSCLEQATTVTWVHPPAPCGSEHKVFEDTYVAELDHQRRGGIWSSYFPSQPPVLFSLLSFSTPPPPLPPPAPPHLLLPPPSSCFSASLQLVQVFKSSSLRPEFSSSSSSSFVSEAL